LTGDANRVTITTIFRHVQLNSFSYGVRMIHRIDNYEYLLFAFSCDLDYFFFCPFDDFLLWHFFRGGVNVNCDSREEKSRGYEIPVRENHYCNTV
jgi:hypothetical protein